jgi:hypothetical protein
MSNVGLVVLAVVIFAALYILAVFGWTGWKLRQAGRVLYDPEWTAAIKRGDFATADKFHQEARRLDAEYESFCRRFAPYLLP